MSGLLDTRQPTPIGMRLWARDGTRYVNTARGIRRDPPKIRGKALVKAIKRHRQKEARA